MDVFREGEPSEEAALEWLSKVVKIFRKCRKLELKVSCSNEGGVKEEDLIRTCKVLPCRDVDVYVVIGDVNYQYPDWLLYCVSFVERQLVIDMRHHSLPRGINIGRGSVNLSIILLTTRVFEQTCGSH